MLLIHCRVLDAFQHYTSPSSLVNISIFKGNISCVYLSLFSHSCLMMVYIFCRYIDVDLFAVLYYAIEWFIYTAASAKARPMRHDSTATSKVSRQSRSMIDVSCSILIISSTVYVLSFKLFSANLFLGHLWRRKSLVLSSMNCTSYPGPDTKRHELWLMSPRVDGCQ